MNPTERELLRTALLQALDMVGGMELPVSRLLLGAKAAGFREADATCITTELRYLQDKGLVFSPEKLVSPENREWRITAAGRDYLASKGL